MWCLRIVRIALLCPLIMPGCGTSKAKVSDTAGSPEVADLVDVVDVHEIMPYEAVSETDVAVPMDIVMPEVSVAASCDEGEPLALLDKFYQGQGGIHGIDRLWRMAISPDGKHLYGGNTAYDGVNGPIKRTDKIAVFERDLESGTLTWKETLSDLSQMLGLVVATARSVAVSPDGAFVYVQWDEGVLASLQRDQTTGALGLFQTVETGPLFNEIAVWPDGSLLVGAVSNKAGEGDKLLILRREPETNELVLAQEIALDVGITCPVQYKIWYSLNISPDGHHLYVLAEHQAILLFELDANTNKLALVAEYPMDGGPVSCPWQGTQQLAISPDGLHQYLLSVTQTKSFDYGGQIQVFERDSYSGLLTELETTVWQGTEFWGWLATGMLRVSPDGLSVYADFGGAVLANYARDAATGSLELVDKSSPENYFILSPDGSNVYLASYFYDVLWDQLRVFSRDQETGTLSGIQEVAEGEGGVRGLVSPSTVDCSPDGRFAYVVASHSLAWFEVSEVDNTVTPVGLYEETPEEGYVLGYNADLKVSPQGEFIYVAGGSGCPIIFARETETGDVNLIPPDECNPSAIGCDFLGCTGGFPSSLTFSPDGKNLYGVTWGDGEYEVFAPVFTVYAVDAVDGSLAVIQADWSAQCSIDDDGYDEGHCLATPARALVSPDGENVYLTWPSLGRIQIFSRDTATGKLVEVGSVEEGKDGVPSDAIRGEMAISGSGNHLYVAGNKMLSLFERALETGHLLHLQTVDYQPVQSTAAWHSASSLSIDSFGLRILATSGYGVTIYSRDQASGELEFGSHVTAWEPTWGFGVSTTMSPNGHLMFATNWDWDWLEVLEVCDPNTN
jgi:6-phosphogluconolactonase (cycloisomerase 2 family)